MLLRLALSNFRVHKVRFALTVAAIALSVSLVVSVTSGYACVQGAAEKFFGWVIGSTDARIFKTSDSAAPMSEDLVKDLEADADVERVVERLETELAVADPSTFLTGRVADISAIRRPMDKRVERLQMVQGEWFESDSGEVAVIDQEAAKVFQLKLGDTFVLPRGERRLKLKVVGIVHKPGFIASQVQTVYLPLRTLQQFLYPQDSRKVNVILIELRRGADLSSFQ